MAQLPLMRNGGVTQRTAGKRFISPVNGGARMNPDAMREAAATARESVAAHARPAAIGAGEKTVARAATEDLAGAGGRAIETGAASKGGRALINTFKNNKALFIGAGVAVGAYAYMNRRGKGTSSGRSSSSRY